MERCLKILHLEDDVNDIELIRSIIEDEGIHCEIRPVDQRGDFLHELDHNACDLIMSDYSLPGFDGRSALQLSQKKCPEIPFIFVSGALGEENAIEMLKLGATDYVLKNHLSRLVPAVRRALREQKEKNERIKAEKALRQSEARYRDFFEDDLTGDFISTPAGKILTCNPAFLKMFGFKTIEEVNSSDITFLYPNPRNREAVLNQIRQNKRLENYEVSLQKVNGDPVYVVANLIGLFNESEKLTQIKGYLFDITERKKLEEQLTQAQKMEAVGRLAGGVAHDFNNLLTVINGYSDLLSNHIDDEDFVRTGIAQIKKAGERARSLTTQLLAFSRKQIIQPRRLNLNDIIHDLGKMLKRLIEENIELNIQLQPGLHEIKADPTQVEQIIMNLTVNARDAMPKGGTLTIETQDVEIDSEFAKANIGAESGRYNKLSISDTGIGMDEETLSHIFEPFFSTKTVGKGTGLGLSTVYGIVKQNGGFITVSSEIGIGTVFNIYFKSSLEEAPVAGRSTVSQKKLSGEETILLVEDNQAVRELILEVLKGHQYRVIQAQNGTEAVEICDSFEGKIHLLLTDVIMPNMNGRELADYFQSKFQDGELLFMSGYTDNNILEEDIIGKYRNFIHKPFNPRELVMKVREILDGAGAEKNA